MHPRLVCVDLPKDRRPEVYRFRPPRGEAKGGGGATHLLGKSKLCSRKNADRRCGIFRRSKPSSTRVEVDCPKLVTDLGRPRFYVVETEVTHGRGTPLMSRSPRPFPSSKTVTEFQSCKALRAVARRERPVARSSPRRPSAPARSGAGARFSGPHCRASRVLIRARILLMAVEPEWTCALPVSSVRGSIDSPSAAKDRNDERLTSV